MGSKSTKPVSGPNSDAFFPTPDDSQEELEKKYKMNRDAAWGEIGTTIIFGGETDDLTDYQANAMLAQDYLKEKNK